MEQEGFFSFAHAFPRVTKRVLIIASTSIATFIMLLAPHTQVVVAACELGTGGSGC